MSTKVTLPSRSVIIDRLDREFRYPHLKKHFFPLITAHAGEEVDAEEVAQILFDAITSYANGHPLVKAILAESTMEMMRMLISDRRVCSDAVSAARRLGI